MSFKDYFTLLRPMNCFMAALAVLIGYWISIGTVEVNLVVLLAMLSVFFTCGAGQAVNDFFDKEIDAKLNPNKPIPSKRVKANSVLMYSFVLFGIGIVIASLLNYHAYIISLLFSFLLFAYSAFMKKVKYIGNLVVAAGTAFTFIFGASLSGHYLIPALFALQAFLANWGREVTKDLADASADKGMKITLAQILSEKTVKFIVLGIYFLALLSSFIPIYIGKVDSFYYLALMGIANVLFIFSVQKVFNSKFTSAHNLQKKAMIVALIAFASVLIR